MCLKLKLTSILGLLAIEEPQERKKLFGYRQKEILKEISAYFNPGQMVAGMGPSGCGKTTFLNLMTGRRKTGTFQVCS